MFKATMTAVATAAAGLVLAASAHADDQSYLEYLRDNGVPDQIWPWDDANLLRSGKLACRDWRDGIVTVFPPIYAVHMNQIASGAHNELCPDVPLPGPLPG